jgi:LPS-assembly protein
MRGPVIAALVLLSATGTPQIFPAGSFRGHFGELRQRGLLPDPKPPERTALDPKSSEPTLQTGDIPNPNPIDPQAPEIRIIKAPHMSRTGDTVRFWGGVQIQYKGYDLFCEEVIGDLATQVFTMKGGAQLIGADAIIDGETITVDFKNRTFLAQKHRGEIKPSLLQGQSLSSLYTKGDEASGSEREITLKGGGATTCDLEKRHYELDARYTTIRPGKRIIMRDVKLRILGRTVLNIPYLSIPLDTRRERYVPEVGQSADQGYYIKTVWGIPVEGVNTLDSYVDYFEKLGLGLGGRFRYASSHMTGFLRLYGLIGNTATAEMILGHRQNFGDNQFSLESNYQQRNYINAPQNTTWSTRANVTIPHDRNLSRLNYSRYSNESSTFSSLNQVISVGDSRHLSSSLKTDLDVAYITNKSTFSSSPDVERQQIDVRFKGAQDFRKLVAELEYQRSIPIGETTNFFSATDRTPVFALRSDSQRLMGQGFARRWPIQAELSFGEFANPSRSESVTRTFFDLALNKPESRYGRSSAGLQSRFRQSFYGDGTAQFAIQVNANYRYGLSRNTGVNLRYSYLRARGYTPLSIDRLGGSNFLSGDVSFRAMRSLSLGVQTGYDFRHKESNLTTPWQQVAVRAEYLPNADLVARALSVYDPISKKWSTTRIDVTYQRNDFYFGVGARYDGIRSRWANINIFVDGLRWKKFSATAILAYNGYTNQFDSTQYQLVYDMHCTEAVLQVIDNRTGFRSGREVFVFVRIKAFPSSSPFGVGRFGQPIGTATGFGY